MTLKDYIKKLQNIEKQYPNVKVIFSSDAEGNSYDEVYYDPTLGNYEDGDFSTDEYEEVNAVCVN